MSKLEKAISLLYLYRVDKKSPTGFASGEHIALTLTMDGSHILLDVGKTILSMYLTPGDEGESIPMLRSFRFQILILILRNDINAEPLRWTFKNINGIINVKVRLN